MDPDTHVGQSTWLLRSLLLDFIYNIQGFLLTMEEIDKIEDRPRMAPQRASATEMGLRNHIKARLASFRPFTGYNLRII